MARLQELSAEQTRRYARQLLLPEIGTEGQRRLTQARVLVVGLGGLGSPAAQYLAAAGIGNLTLVDPDRVEESNLHRQLLYTPADVGREKVRVAANRLRALSPEIAIEEIGASFRASNARELVRGHDVVLDGTDNFAARYAVNDACVLERVPNVHAAVLRFEGQLTVLGHGDGPCYRCLFPHPPDDGSVPSCAEAGVLGVLPGILGTLQATEALKLLLDAGELLVGRMLTYDALRSRFAEVRLRRDPDCPACGSQPTLREVEDLPRCAPTDRGAAASSEDPYHISVDELSRRLSEPDPPTVLDVRLAEELEIARLPGPLVHIPLHLLPSRCAELDAGREYAVICHHGIRSQQAVRMLLERGFVRPRNVVGGIEQWSLNVDDSVRRY
jgi:adenylyltransferase/sulfurtransferase